MQTVFVRDLAQVSLAHLLHIRVLYLLWELLPNLPALPQGPPPRFSLSLLIKKPGKIWEWSLPLLTKESAHH